MGGERYGLVNPVPTVVTVTDDPAVQARDGQRDPARPAGVTRRQVKWLLRPAFEQWRDIGLRGFGFGGQRRPGWRGFNEDRDTAFVDGLYGTGLRLAEWSSILDVELPGEDDASGRFPRAWLAAACIKGGREGRYYRIPRSVMKSVAAYLDPVEGSRADDGVVVCYEADELDPVRHTGWSVIATGMARLVRDPDAITRYQQLLEP